MLKIWAFIGLLLIIVTGKVDPEVIKQRQNYQVKRMACMILSKYYYFVNKEAIESIIIELGPQHQLNFEMKRSPIAMEHCMNKIPYDKATKLIFQERNKNPTHLMWIFDDFNYKPIIQHQGKLTKEQQSLLKFVKSYDDETQIEREQQQAIELEKQKRIKTEMIIFGISTEQIPMAVQLMFFGLFIGAIAVGLLVIWKKIEAAEPQEKNKKKKNRQIKKSK